MPVRITNRLGTSQAVPAPIETVLAPNETREFEYVEYDEIRTDARFLDLVARDLILLFSADETPYSNAVVVAKTGAQFTTIQSGIDAANGATQDTPIAVLVYPGRYEENVTMRDWVNVRGMGTGPNDTTITAATGTAATWPAGMTGTANFDNVGITVTAANAAAHAVEFLGGAPMDAHYLTNCQIEGQPQNLALDLCVFAGGAVVTFNHCLLRYFAQGVTVGANTHRVVHVTGDATPTFWDCSVLAACQDPDDDLTLLEEDVGHAVETGIRNSQLLVFAMDPAHTGNLIGVLTRSVTSPAGIANSTLSLISNSAASTLYGVYVDAGGGGNITVSSANVQVVGPGTNYLSFAAAGDMAMFLYSNFTAAAGSTGPGATNLLTADATGRFSYTGGSIYFPGMKSGINQGAAGAVTGELWADTSDGNTVKLGV